MTPNQNNSLPARVQQAITKDAKKSLVLTSLVLLLGILWFRMMFGGKAVPASASAMSHGLALPALDPTPKSASANGQAALHTWLEQPLPSALSRNLFETKLEYFPTDTAHSSSSGTIADPTFWDALAKSMDAQADQQHKREILIQNLRQQAGQLQLTSTVMGPRPKAVINGQMVGEGEIVAQFRVVKIDARNAVVERDGVRLEIALQ
jgi:hypothetical protein